MTDFSGTGQDTLLTLTGSGWEVIQNKKVIIHQTRRTSRPALDCREIQLANILHANFVQHNHKSFVSLRLC